MERVCVRVSICIILRRLRGRMHGRTSIDRVLCGGPRVGNNGMGFGPLVCYLCGADLSVDGKFHIQEESTKWKDSGN
jgi:hypothetical protein